MKLLVSFAVIGAEILPDDGSDADAASAQTGRLPDGKLYMAGRGFLKGIGKHVFFALPFVETLTKSREHGYGLQVKQRKSILKISNDSGQSIVLNRYKKLGRWMIMPLFLQLCPYQKLKKKNSVTLQRTNDPELMAGLQNEGIIICLSRQYPQV